MGLDSFSANPVTIRYQVPYIGPVAIVTMGLSRNMPLP